MTTVLTASGSEEFLSAVPSLAGFTPTRSLMLLPFRGTRTAGALRVDLPDATIDLAPFVDGLIELLLRVDGTNALAIVVYTDDDGEQTGDGLVLAHSVLVDLLLAGARSAQLRIVDALCVTPGGWAAYLDEQPVIRPLVVPAPTVPGVGDVSGDQTTGISLPPADLAEKERVGRAMQDIDLLLSDRRGTGPERRINPQAITAVAALEDLPAFFEAVLETPGSVAPFVTAALLWTLDRPMLRDVALTQWATDQTTGERTLEAQFAFSARGVELPSDIGDIFLGLGPAPSADRLMLALSVVRGAAARAPRASRPAPLTIAAWLSWALGRTSHAAHYLDQVREIDPGYGLAEILGTLIETAVLPEWAFRRGSAATT